VRTATVLIGERYGRLVVLAEAGRAKNGGRLFQCQCDCGAQHTVIADALRDGRVRSCGCLRREIVTRRMTTHGARWTPEYNIWCCMLARCHNPRNPGYDNYGGRGIEVCERWRNSFAAFLADLGERPGPSYSIDRKDNDGNYEPGNVRWATATEQGRNTRANRIVVFNGSRMPLVEACEIAGVSYCTVRTRLDRLGWPVERALTQNG